MSDLQQVHWTTASRSWAAAARQAAEGKGSEGCEGTSIVALVLGALTRSPQKDRAAAQMRLHLAA